VNPAGVRAAGDVRTAAPQVRRIRPRSGGAAAELASLFREREILFFLVWRDVKVRYKSTALGIGWAIVQPLVMMLIFTLVFGRIAGLGPEGIPYPVFAFTGLLPWQLFAHALTDASNSLVANQSLVTKVYFPRSALPVSAVLTGLIDLAVSAVALVALLLWYRLPVGPGVLLLPLFAGLALVAALAAGIWLAAINVEYRDVRYVLPFLTQVWLLATPVAYPERVVPEPWRQLLGLNPMAGVVEGFRSAILGAPFDPVLIGVSASTAFLGVITGLLYFARMEREFADVI
jgi:lipopolysaccharide transport system permease protein